MVYLPSATSETIKCHQKKGSTTNVNFQDRSPGKHASKKTVIMLKKASALFTNIGRKQFTSA